jgi:predicted nucleotidyltransferase/HEPN domain-containing protein
MKTKIEDLPSGKQDELKKIVAIIREHGRAEMVVLFGSYARGTAVEDQYVCPEDGITYEYRSDFDILVVTRSKIGAKSGVWQKIENLITRDPAIKTPVSMIVHDIRELNNQLSTGEYFFTDVVKDGILLYDSGKYVLEQPKELSSQKRAEIALKDYEYWYESASDFLDGFKFYMSGHKLNKAAFLLNQTIEHALVCTLLVFTHYKPKLHDLNKLINMAADQDHRLATVFPVNGGEEKRRFDLVNNAYIHARYTRSYSITDEDLKYLFARTEKLMVLTKEVCAEHIKQLAGG